MRPEDHLKAEDHPLPPAADGEDVFASIRRKLEKALVGFAPGDAHDVETRATSSTKPDPADFPVPELVLVTLGRIMAYPTAGVGEKVRWSIYAQFKGEALLLELRKFGFTICVPPDAKVHLRRVVGQLKAAMKIVETWLQPYAQGQVNDGNVTIANRFSEFDARYRFFRANADKAYKRSNTPAPKVSLDIEGALAKVLNHGMRDRRDGFFYSTAMVDAYFSRLEHLLVLLLAFRARPLVSGDLSRFLRARWDDKLNQIINVEHDRAAQLVLGRLRNLKERIRNPFAHGGVENDGGSLFFHLPGIGALPANFSQIKDSVRFSFMPVEHEDHQSACGLFDELDVLLESGDLTLPHRLVDAGVDPAFDAETLARYIEATLSPAATEDFISRWSYEWMTHANMDY